MAKYRYKVLIDCVRNDFGDTDGVKRAQRFKRDEFVESPSPIDSPKFELDSYTPDPPKAPAKEKPKA